MRVLMVLGCLLLAGCAQPSETIPIEEADDHGLTTTEDGRIDLAAYGVNGDPFVGNPDAEVQVVSYEAPGCSNCKRYHFNELPSVLADYADTGRIGYHFLQYTIGYAYDISGGIAAECAHREGGTEAYKHIMDRIFEHQSANRLPEYLEDTATAFDLDPEVLQACYDDQETLPEVQADVDGGRDTRAGSNPGFAIIGPDGVEHVTGTAGPRAAIERALA